GASRDQDFRNTLPGISPTVLSDRLKTLEAHGIVKRSLYSEHPPRAEYSLTPKGRELGPVLKAIREWGEAHHA
ncbi:MAG: helix-turn-helix domain-containing protein, partial [Cyanobacteria bacterium P01_F01_bin.42]